MAKVHTFNDPEDGAKQVSTPQDITEARIRSITLRHLRGRQPSISVQWDEGYIESSQFVVHNSRRCGIKGDDATDILNVNTLGPPKQSVRNNIEQKVLEKLVELGKLPAGSIS